MANVGILPYFIIDLNVKYLPASFPNTAISDTDLGLLTEVLIGGWPRVSLISKHWTQDMIYLHMHYPQQLLLYITWKFAEHCQS